MCVDAANCGGYCPECQAQTIERLRAELARVTAELAQFHAMVFQEAPGLLAQLAEVERERDELRAARMAYAKEFALNEEGEPDVGSIHANIRVLKIRAERLEAAIWKAPHTHWCAIHGALDSLIESYCNCWKRAALGDK